MDSKDDRECLIPLSPFVRFAHYFRTGEGFRIARRVIYDHLLLYTKEGYGWLTIDGQRFRQTPGTLFLFRPRVLHAFHADDGHDNLLMYNLHFDFVERDDSRQIPFCRGSVEETEAYPELFRDDPTLAPPFALPVVIEQFSPEFYEQSFFEMLNHLQRPDLAGRLRVKAAMIGLLAHLYQQRDRRNGQPRVGSAGSRLDGIMRFMHEHLSEALTLEQLAARCHLSPSHFTACFRAAFGASPLQYLTRLRIERARYELAHHDTPVKAIAADLGFPTVHYFTRVFARQTGVPPATYRRQWRETSAE